jgi:putative DNA primase/helicase
VGRYSTDEGKKLPLCWTYGRFQGEHADRWAVKHFSKPRPLYNLHTALKHPERQIVVVEGEKCAEAAQGVLRNQVVLTWPGGAMAAKYADLTPLQSRLSDEHPKGRQAFLWPDNDDGGRQAMQEIGEALFIMGYDVMVVAVTDKPEGWDCADALEEAISLPAYIREHATPLLRARTDEVLPPELPPTIPEPRGRDPQTPTETHDQATNNPVAERHQQAPTDLWRIDDWIATGLSLANSKPVPNLSNICKVLTVIKSGDIWWDEFLGQVLTRTSDNKDVRQWTDADDTMLTIELQARCGLVNVPHQLVARAVQAHARKDIRNEVTDYLSSLTWDGMPRLHAFFEDICAAPGTLYYQQAARNFFIGMVARAFRPGCKLDTMIVLEGKQGHGKSTLLEVVGGRWYAIMRDSPETKDFGITLQGKLLIEIAEMDAFTRADVKTVKRTLSTPSDRYRPPYGTHAEDHPRTCVFAGTTNKTEWLSDETGARRFWPIECEYIRLDLLRANRDQYFAEAAHLFREGWPWWEIEEAEAKLKQAQRYENDPWQEHVEAILMGRASVTIPVILEKLDVPVQHQDKKSQMRIANILTHLGYVRKVIWDGEAQKSRRLWMMP